MNERTDLGWWIYDKVDPGAIPYLSSPTFSGGIFSATTQTTGTQDYGNIDPEYSDAQIYLLPTDFPDTSHIGKFGSNYKIDASKYTVFAIRMCVTPDPSTTLTPLWSVGQLFWSQNTIYSDITLAGNIDVLGGWTIYLISIPGLPTKQVLGTKTEWSGLKDSLRFDPTVIPNEKIQIDWVRLVGTGQVYNRTITGTGDANTPYVDIYLDDNADPSDGNLGLLAQNVKGTQSPTNGLYSYSYQFLAGGLAAGNYYADLVATGGDPLTAGVSSPGYYQVTEQPIVVLTKPSAEGSDQDFMTVASGNPWDFNDIKDVDYTLHVNNAVIKPNFTYEDQVGNVQTGNNVYDAIADKPASGSIGDPTVFFLSSAYRGKTYKIDSTRYHNLVAKMGIYGDYSAIYGSIARVMYMRTDKHTEGECVSQDILINHKAGTPVMNKIVADLKTLPLETSTATYGWTGLMDSFRIDPHEFPDGREFFYDDVKITADWRADASFDIEWTADAPSGTTVSFYYDTDRSGYDGTLIVPGLAASAGSYTWDLRNVTPGTYYIYAEVTYRVTADFYNTNKYYATGPLIVDHTVPPQIGLSRNSLNFTKIKGGNLTPPESVALTNAGQGTMTWTARSSAKWLSVMPLSGTGPKALIIKIVNVLTMSVGTYLGTVTVTCPGAANSPQVINVTLTVKAAKTDAAPFGALDTPPADDSSFGASVTLAGWALDDVGMKNVRIFRKSGTTATSKTLIGKATFVAGARPDIEARYPDNPQNYKAGWTYTLKSSLLPNGGKGTFTIMAFATDTFGHTVLLGKRTLIGTGAKGSAGVAAIPFGSLDEPPETGTVSGTSFLVTGWALTPPPNDIPTDGSTVTVWVDGLALGHPVYGNFRQDVEAEYPECSNAARGAGYFDLNTTKLADGWHTLAWSAADSSGAVGEIGSRYFRVQNEARTGGIDAVEADAEDASPVVANAVGPPRPIEDIAAIPEDLWTAIYCERGFNDGQAAETVYPESDGTVRIEIPELSRVAIHLTTAGVFEDAAAREARVRRILREAKNPPETTRFEAYAFICGQLRGLPIGASFDSRDGVFLWQPGPGFVGEYSFIFVTNDGARPTRKAVKIVIVPAN